MNSTELDISAVIGFKGKALALLAICFIANSLLICRQGELGADSAPRQRAHHLPSGHHHHRQTHY